MHLHARPQRIPITKYKRKQGTVSEYQEKHQLQGTGLQTSDIGIISRETENTIATIKELKKSLKIAAREQEP